LRDLSDKHKLSVKSLGEIQEGLSALVMGLKQRGLSYQGKSITREQLVNAMLLYLFELPPEDREKMLAWGFVKLKALQEKPDSEGVELTTLAIKGPAPVPMLTGKSSKRK
jgi:hypothetical protein